jgi:hypothetical protein
VEKVTHRQHCTCRPLHSASNGSFVTMLRSKRCEVMKSVLGWLYVRVLCRWRRCFADTTSLLPPKSHMRMILPILAHCFALKVTRGKKREVESLSCGALAQSQLY